MRGWQSRTIGASACALIALAAHPPVATAYRTASGADFEGTPKVRWGEGSVRLAVSGGAPDELQQVEVVEVARRAAWTWTATDCAVELHVLEVDNEGVDPPSAIVSWVDHGWAVMGFANDAPGATEIAYELDEGGQWRIVEAKVFLNAESFDWSLELAPSDDRRSLQSVLTHEFGHALGLMHPCEIGGLDGAPDCADDHQLEAAALSPFYLHTQSSLATDDVAGICYLYPCTGSCRADEYCGADGCMPVCGEGPCADPTSAGPVEVDGEPELTCGESDCHIGEMVGMAAGGDPCTADLDCMSGACVDAACATLCAADEDCIETQSCELELPAGVCTGPGIGFGGACEHAGECLGRQCVGELDSAGMVCSRACDDERARCPGGWECAEVETRLVCVPSPAEGAGCTTRTGRTTRSGTVLAVFAMAGALLVRRRRSRPTHCSGRPTTKESQ